jgi:hypothetical protein
VNFLVPIDGRIEGTDVGRRTGELSTLYPHTPQKTGENMEKMPD